MPLNTASLKDLSFLPAVSYTTAGFTCPSAWIIGAAKRNVEAMTAKPVFFDQSTKM